MKALGAISRGVLFVTQGGRCTVTRPVWDLSTGRKAASLEAHTGAVLSAAWSPDGTILASATAR